MVRSRFSQRHMCILRPVVQSLVRPMLDVRHHLSPGCSIGAQLVSDHALRRNALLLQQPRQQALGRIGVAAVLDDLVEHIAILVDGAPQPVFPAGNGDDDLVQVPDVVSAGLLAAQAASEIRPEFNASPADGLIRNHDPALQQHFLGQTQAQGEPVVEPDCMSDDLRRETMALVADGPRCSSQRVYAANP